MTISYSNILYFIEAHNVDIHLNIITITQLNNSLNIINYICYYTTP